MPVSPEPGPTLGPRAVGVLQARDGQILTWREYQDTLAITQALSRPPPEPHQPHPPGGSRAPRRGPAPATDERHSV